MPDGAAVGMVMGVVVEFLRSEPNAREWGASGVRVSRQKERGTVPVMERG